MWFLTKNQFLPYMGVASIALNTINKASKRLCLILEKQYAHNLQWTITMWTAISSFALSVEIVLANVIETERNLIAVLGIQLQFWHACRKSVSTRSHQKVDICIRAFSCSNCSLSQERHIADKPNLHCLPAEKLLKSNCLNYFGICTMIKFLNVWIPGRGQPITKGALFY